MSFGDGSRGRINGDGGRADESLGWRLARPLSRVVARLQRHTREWPGRYVDQQAELYEK
ncbi:hypothetical protein [Halobacterium jilantaiense]|uniref:Uncharacterized protein n=1 Tax=Halobacterium jilantaiense TaxID=355548 RepID=A0A1I0PPW6_9EURY|nr:hypothetical protein [Halobacterium jilantaiense]SEW16402.1 hypothetical protein SAMN04487945_1854 [Halobacterium jilantaiense]